MKERHKFFYKCIDEEIRKQREKLGLTLEDLELKMAELDTEENAELETLILIELGMRFRETREKQGLSLEELAKKANVTIGEIQHLELGTDGIGLAEEEDVRIALGLDARQLWEGLNYDEFTLDPIPKKKRKNKPKRNAPLLRKGRHFAD